MSTQPEGSGLKEFAADLRHLRTEAGVASYRALAGLAHYSHTSLAEAAAGKVLPSLEVTMAFVIACGGDRHSWRKRWIDLSASLARHLDPVPALSPWPSQEVVDGADPLDSGCSVDAVTVSARKISLADRRHIIGEIELRYCPRQQAAWGRFIGMDGFDTLAIHRHDVELTVGITREPDGTSIGYRDEYRFDYHWGDLLKTGVGSLYAWVIVRFDGVEVARGETERLELS